MTTKSNLCSFCTKSHDVGDREGDNDVFEASSFPVPSNRKWAAVALSGGSRMEALRAAKKRKKSTRQVSNEEELDKGVETEVQLKSCVLCRNMDCKSYNRCNELKEEKLVNKQAQVEAKEKEGQSKGDLEEEPSEEEREAIFSHKEALNPRQRSHHPPPPSSATASAAGNQPSKHSQESSKSRPTSQSDAMPLNLADNFRSIDDLRAVNEYCKGRRSRREKKEMDKKGGSPNRSPSPPLNWHKSGRKDWNHWMRVGQKATASPSWMTLAKLVAYLYFIFIVLNNVFLFPIFVGANTQVPDLHIASASETGGELILILTDCPRQIFYGE